MGNTGGFGGLSVLDQSNQEVGHMMNIVIPMAGEGKRFFDQGYHIHKPAIPVQDRRSGRNYPMVVCATMDLPGVLKNGGNVVYIDRDFHKRDGVEQSILKHYPEARFITVDTLTDGQASTCMLAKGVIDRTKPLLIAGCDNGMAADENEFLRLTSICDVLVFTYRNNPSVLRNPNAYGWVRADSDGKITEVSIKKAISGNPVKDHAIVATFWFKTADIFFRSAGRMIAQNDRINNEFYVDQSIKHAMDYGYDVRIFEIGRYIGWGTPGDYEDYMHTLRYWKEFVKSKAFLPGDAL